MEARPVFNKAWEFTSEEKEKTKIRVQNAKGGFDL